MSAQTMEDAAKTRPARVAGAPPRPPFRLLALLAAWLRRSSQRTLLAELDERSLRDMGLTRYDVTREIQKPFWRE